MKPDIKKRWVDALRSGRYKQGRNALQTKGGFCCLGVLCELAADEGIVEKWFSPAYNEMVYDGNNNYLPAKVTTWAELDYPDPVVKLDSGNVFQLSLINDKGQSFEYIADLIEKQL